MEISIKHGLETSRGNEFRDLKLEALTNEPLAFSPGIEAYHDYKDDDWQDELERAQTPPNLMVFAESEDERLVGMIGVRFYQLPQFQHNAGLQSLYVSPEYRGVGIGKELVSEALTFVQNDTTQENVVCEIVSSQQASLKLHRSFGFSIVGTFENFVQYKGQYYDNYFLQKKLT